MERREDDSSPVVEKYDIGWDKSNTANEIKIWEGNRGGDAMRRAWKR